MFLGNNVGTYVNLPHTKEYIYLRCIGNELPSLLDAVKIKWLGSLDKPTTACFTGIGMPAIDGSWPN